MSFTCHCVYQQSTGEAPAMVAQSGRPVRRLLGQRYSQWPGNVDPLAESQHLTVLSGPFTGSLFIKLQGTMNLRSKKYAKTKVYGIYGNDL